MKIILLILIWYVFIGFFTAVAKAPVGNRNPEADHKAISIGTFWLFYLIRGSCRAVWRSFKIFIKS